MSFDRLSSLESQPTTTRRQDDAVYRDDPEFQRFTENLSTRLFELVSNVSRLSNEIAKLGTSRDTERVRERVHNLLEETRDGFKDVGEGIKKAQSWEDLNAAQKYTNQKLSREFSTALTEFQVVQRRALEKERQSKAALEDASGTVQSPSGEGQQQLQQMDQPQLAEQSEVDFQENLIIEREGEIRQIEQSVGELNELFRDVAHIVREQGDMLDTIDVNVENTLQDTRGADVELRSASRYQKQARNKACCLLLILAIVLVIVVLAVVLG
ncbi:SNAP receptor [Lithohypha guttulata]|uniref:SNAP receptor n=1 Tax=Lithohypha guttulata TaxID=1690604 RepID=A0AAN7TBA1_9EURO|nr:SNAP receptor [Lithohypha guttulata]KAK5090149.1 SNAP receptor [Lithohypha guttulata]KAK5096796.1 SNAP receptor [Lithohypha guttulata]